MSGNVRYGMLSLKGIMGRFAIALAVMLTMGLPLSAAQGTKPTYQQAADALYNLDFSIAEHAFDSLIATDESNPDYWNGLASTMWLKIFYDQQKLNIESYSGGSIGTRNSRDYVNPEEEKKLRGTIDTAIDKANARLKKNPNEVPALYALGVSNSTMAAFEGIAKRSYYAALTRAKAARAYHERVIKLDPNFNDALVSIGTYEYGIGVIPPVYRLFLGFFGVSGGSKEAGIRDLEKAATQGDRARTDAKTILIVIYYREHQYDQSLRLIDDLLAKYPRDFQLEIERAQIYGRMKNWSQAVDVYHHVLSKIQEKQDGYERLRNDRVYAQLGFANVSLGKSDDAIAAYNQVTGSSLADDNEKANAYLWIGKIYDSGNERGKAVDQYNAILALNCNNSYKEEARAYLRKAFGG